MCECRLRAADPETPRRPALVPRKTGVGEVRAPETRPGGDKRNARLARGCERWNASPFTPPLFFESSVSSLVREQVQ